MPQFIHPLLLWGALAAAVPVLIHLLHRRRFRRQRWAAMEWLLVAAKQNRKRLQMENLLLLLVRTLAVLFISLAITRPTFSDISLLLGPARQTHLYVVLDNSGSTSARAGTRTALDDGMAAVSSLLAGLRDDDPVTLVLTNDNWGASRTTGRPRAILRETRDHGAVRRRLGEVKPAPARADLAAAVKLLEDPMPATSTMLRRVAIVSDLQEISVNETRERDGADDPLRRVLVSLRDKGAEVILVPTGRDVPNVAVTALRTAEDRDVVQGSNAIFQAEIRNYADRPQKVEVRFVLDGEERGQSSQWVTVPARNAGPDAPPAATAQYHTSFGPADVGIHVLEARIRADGMPLDDIRAFAFSVRPRVQVLAVDGDPNPGDPGRTNETFFLVPALALKEDGPIAVRRVSEAEYHGLATLDGWDMIVLANVERPAPDDAARERLEGFVSRGGALLLTVGDRVVPQRWNDEIWRRPAGVGGSGGAATPAGAPAATGRGSLLPVRLGTARVDPTAVLRFDLSGSKHPLLANLNDPESAVYFQSPVLTGLMTVEGIETERDARTALTFLDLANSPAIVEKRFGRGRVVLLTTTIDDAWGRLPGSLIYPALLHEIVYWTTTRGDDERNLHAFQTWNRAVSADLATATVTAPDGREIPTEKETSGGQSSISVDETGQTGVFRVVLHSRPKDILGAKPKPEPDAFTVSMTATESDLRRVEPERMLSRYQNLLRTSGQSEAMADAVKTKAGEIAGPLLAGALACLLLEVFMVQRIGRGRRA